MKTDFKTRDKHSVFKKAQMLRMIEYYKVTGRFTHDSNKFVCFYKHKLCICESVYLHVCLYVCVRETERKRDRERNTEQTDRGQAYKSKY